MSKESTETEQNCYEDRCDNCGTVGLRIPDSEGKWAFDFGATICRDGNGVIAHPDEVI